MTGPAEPRRCGDCAVLPGEPHHDGCDVARCLRTGGQRLACGEDHDCGNQVWTGAWPGDAECSIYGWHSYFEPGRGWVRCDPGHPEAGPDLNRLGAFSGETEWDPVACRYRRRGEDPDDTSYIRWHQARGLPLEPSARYVVNGETVPAGDLARVQPGDGSPQADISRP